MAFGRLVTRLPSCILCIRVFYGYAHGQWPMFCSNLATFPPPTFNLANVSYIEHPHAGLPFGSLGDILAHIMETYDGYENA